MTHAGGILGEDVGLDRFKRMGRTATGRMVVVVYTERGDDTIRIVSARKAKKHEERAYHQG